MCSICWITHIPKQSMWPELPFAFWLSHVYEHTAMHLPRGFWTWLTHVTLSLSFHSLCVQCFCLPTTNFCTREQTSHSICIFPFWSCCNTHYLLADNSMARPLSPHSSFYVHALGFLTAYFTHHTFTHLLPIYWSPASDFKRSGFNWIHCENAL